MDLDYIEMTADEAYLSGADCGRQAAKAPSGPALESLTVDLYTWRGMIQDDFVADSLEPSFRDGWWKAFYDARTKLRAKLRATV